MSRESKVKELCPIGKKILQDLRFASARRRSFEYGNNIDSEWYSAEFKERELANTFYFHNKGAPEFDIPSCQVCSSIKESMDGIRSGWQDEIDMRGAIYKLRKYQEIKK